MEDWVERIKAIVFDWDGTIVDTMPLKIKNASRIFKKHYGVSCKYTRESYKNHSGVSRKELFNLIAKDNIGKGLSGFEFSKISAEFTLRNINSYKSSTVFNEKYREIFTWLTKRNLMLFVSSSAVKDEIVKLAILLNIKDCFLEILGSFDNFRKGKHHIDYIKKKYALSTNHIMFVGDEKVDMRLSGRLGLMCVGVANGKRKSSLEMEFADYVIQDLTELRSIL
jgi:phosphoglycolate phosphatase-like HAD superfamily hydrolase